MVERHDISNPNYANFIDEVPEERKFYVQWLIDSPFDAGGPLNGVKFQTKVCIAMDTDADRLETWEAWVNWMQMSEAALAVSSGEPGRQITRIINGEERVLTTVEADYFTSAGNWLTAFFLAVTCRDKTRYESLCEIPVDVLRSAGESRGTTYSPHIYPWISALQAFVLNRPGLFDHLSEAMELSDPARPDGFGNGETLNKLVFPPMDTFMHLVRRNSENFNESLALGLELFRSFHTATPERAEKTDGGVPLGLFALACWGYDTALVDPNFRFDVESGYLPKHILERDWIGEFPI
ncbi:immunity 49 family protein [Nocardiopsis prasina]|uniref:immunity 49 family protein n=1 Tax=Nocardiopsis prasina TaxID=2015 RepID=UPI0003471C44|nr:immunity 49 family protein [Nocardiopsis prasina]